MYFSSINCLQAPSYYDESLQRCSDAKELSQRVLQGSHRQLWAWCQHSDKLKHKLRCKAN